MSDMEQKQEGSHTAGSSQAKNWADFENTWPLVQQAMQEAVHGAETANKIAVSAQERVDAALKTVTTVQKDVISVQELAATTQETANAAQMTANNITQTANVASKALETAIGEVRGKRADEPVGESATSIGCPAIHLD